MFSLYFLSTIPSFFLVLSFFSFFFNDTATTEIYTLSLHDALPISRVTPSSSRNQRGLLLGRGTANAFLRSRTRAHSSLPNATHRRDALAFPMNLVGHHILN